jgi:hypothetical protein
VSYSQFQDDVCFGALPTVMCAMSDHNVVNNHIVYGILTMLIILVISSVRYD